MGQNEIDVNTVIRDVFATYLAKHYPFKEDSSMDRKTMEELVNEQREKREPLANISRVDETHFLINNHTYELVSDPANSFDEHEFIDRFSTVFSKYDYIVGDWGFGQLRLKGFFC